MSGDTYPQYYLDWSDLAFKSKTWINNLHPALLLAPREIGIGRFKSIIKEHLPQSNIIICLSKEDYVSGFENQPQFKMLKLKSIKALIDRVNRSSSPHKIYTLSYFQREANYVICKLKPKIVLLINGSWQHAFHNSEVFYTLVRRSIPYEHISPFDDEKEALEYERLMLSKLNKSTSALMAAKTSSKLSDEGEMMTAANNTAKLSFDYNFQTGASLGRAVKSKNSVKYKYLAGSFNKVVPYQTYALHNGASRELNFSPPHDLNHYDTVHAEVEMVLAAGKNDINLKGTSLFLNLMPCPPCSRMLCETGIKEVIYQFDHSDGYAIKILNQAGILTRRLVV